MAEDAATRQVATPSIHALRDSVRTATGYWWVLLVAGPSRGSPSRCVMLQFDQASVTTVGIFVGLMFLTLGIENIALRRWTCRRAGPGRSSAGSFSCPPSSVRQPGGHVCRGIADILGFLFLIVGVWWMIRAFLERALNPLWSLGLISGILMTALAFWTSGKFFIHNAYLLLVLAGMGADAGHHEHRAGIPDPRAARGAVTEFKHDERLSRQQAAERLIDIAYALTAGGPLELIAAGRRITVPVEQELRFQRWLRSNGDRVELELELSSAATGG